MELPDGYYVARIPLEGQFIFKKGSNEKVSMNYHEIMFPRVRVGTTDYELTEHNGHFVPKNELSHKLQLDQTDERQPGVTAEEFEVLESTADYHGVDAPDTSLLGKETPDELLKKTVTEDDEETGTNSFRIH